MREVGDKLEDALANEGEGWKGRAQQIVMLKNKVRRLEREVSEAGVRKRPPRRRRRRRAASELEEARKEREREIQEVFEQKESLQREVFKVKETLQASQARVVAQTQEVQRNKDHIKSLLEKGDGDDELVDALRREVAALKDGLRERDAKIKVLERRRARSASPGRPDDAAERHAAGRGEARARQRASPEAGRAPGRTIEKETPAGQGAGLRRARARH